VDQPLRAQNTGELAGQAAGERRAGQLSTAMMRIFPMNALRHVIIFAHFMRY